MGMFPNFSSPLEGVERVSSVTGEVRVRRRQALRFVVLEKRPVGDDGEFEFVEVPEKSRTKQEFLERADLNTLMKRYRVREAIPRVKEAMEFKDLASAPSYQDALNKVIEAEHAFMQLPATARTKFGNDPGKFLEFLSNPDVVNDPDFEKELRKLGLLKEPIQKDATLNDVVDAVKSSKASDAQQSDAKPTSKPAEQA